MSKNRLALLFSIALTLALAGCRETTYTFPTEKTPPSPHGKLMPPTDKSWQGIQAFSEEVVRATKDEKAPNVIAPAPVFQALLALMKGAEGKTYDAFASVLGVGEEAPFEVIDAQSAWLRDLDQRLGEDGGWAAGIWMIQPYFVSKQFAADVAAGLRVDAVKFGATGPTTINSINAWAKRRSGGRIPGVIESADRNEAFVITTLAWFKPTASGGALREGDSVTWPLKGDLVASITGNWPAGPDGPVSIEGIVLSVTSTRDLSDTLRQGKAAALYSPPLDLRGVSLDFEQDVTLGRVIAVTKLELTNAFWPKDTGNPLELPQEAALTITDTKSGVILVSARLVRSDRS